MQDQSTRGNNDTPHDPVEAQSERRDGVHPVDLTRFQIDQLAAIARLEASSETCYGLAIKRQLEAYYGEDVHHPRSYQNLDTLTELGLVRQSDHDGRTNQYELTAAGRTLLVERAQWLADQAGLRVVDADHSDEHDDDSRPDGGDQCVNCGAALPDEIEDGSGVYCTECGHGQHVTDGGDIRREFCADCTQRVALEDRATHDGLVYHDECAPDAELRMDESRTLNSDINPHTTGGDA